MTRRTPKEETAKRELSHAWRQLQADAIEIEKGIRELALANAMPEGWRGLERRIPCTRARTRITLSVDEDVARFFRMMGTGYQARMNEVLRTYMLARVAKVIGGPPLEG